MAENIKIKIETSGGDKLGENLDKAADGAKSLKAQLKEITLELQNTEVGTARFNELTIAAGKLKDEIADTQAVIKSTAGSPIENLGKGLQGVASIGIRGFQGLMSAQQLFGSESKALEQTLVKLQAVAGLAEAVESLGGLKDTITNVKAGFNSFFTAAKAGLQGIKGAVAATGIGLLLIAVGTMVAYWDDIKSLVSGVSSEQEKLNELAQADVELQNQKMEELNNQDNILKLQGLTEREILQLKIKQTDAQISALENAIEQGRITFESQYAAEKRNRDILKGIMEFISAPLLTILRAVDEIAAFAGFDTNLAEGLKDFTSGLLFNENEVKANYDKTYKEQLKTLNKLKNDKAGYELAIQQIDKQAAQERARVAKEAYDKGKESDANRLQAKRELQDAELELMEEGLEKELLRNKYKYERLIEDTKLNEKLNNDEKKKINDAYAKEKLQQDEILRKADIDNKKQADQEKLDAEKKLIADMRAADNEAYQDEADIRDARIGQMKEGIDKEIAMREAAYQDQLWELQNYLDEEKITREEYDALIIEAEKKKQSDITEIRKKANVEALELKVQEYNDTLEIGNQTLSAIGGLTDLIYANKKKGLEKGSAEEEKYARKQFNINKALQLSTAVITGVQSVMAAFLNGMKNPVPLLGPATAGVYAGLAAVAAATNIAKIAATKFESKSPDLSGGGGGGGSDIPAAPGTTENNLQAPIPSGITITGGALSGSEGGGTQLYGSRQGVIRSYVVESDITNTQNKLQKYQYMAEVGG